MRGRVRVAHLSSSAEKIVSFRLFGLTVMFLMTGVRLDGLTSAAWSRKRQALLWQGLPTLPPGRPKVSRSQARQERRPAVRLTAGSGDPRRTSLHAFTVRPEVLLGTGPTVMW